MEIKEIKFETGVFVIAHERAGKRRTQIFQPIGLGNLFAPGRRIGTNAESSPKAIAHPPHPPNSPPFLRCPARVSTSSPRSTNAYGRDSLSNPVPNQFFTVFGWLLSPKTEITRWSAGLGSKSQVETSSGNALPTVNESAWSDESCGVSASPMRLQRYRRCQ